MIHRLTDVTSTVVNLDQTVDFLSPQLTACNELAQHGKN